jgi:hypothetical protein
MAKGDIDSSKIPVDGVGGLGLLAMAAITMYVVPPLRAVGVPTVLGGVIVGLTLVAIRNRRVRTWAIVGALLATVAFVVAVRSMLGH